MLRAIDTWVGKHLFLPWIIRLLQHTKMTQYAFARYCFMAAFLTLMVDRPHTILGWIVYMIMFLIALLLVLSAALYPNEPFQGGADNGSNGYQWRCLLMILGILADLVPAIKRGYPQPDDFFTFLWLAGSYALTITTIPPLKAKEKKRKVAHQHG